MVEVVSYDFIDPEDPPPVSVEVEEDYSSALDEISNFMNSTSFNDEDRVHAETRKSEDNSVAKNDIISGNEKSPPEEKSSRKAKYYAPVYVVRDRVAGVAPSTTEVPKNREPRSNHGSRDRRTRGDGGTRKETTILRKEDGARSDSTRFDDSPRNKDRPRQIAKRDEEPVVEIKKKDKEDSKSVREVPDQPRKVDDVRRIHKDREEDKTSREAIEHQQKKMEELRRIHEAEQQEREKRLKEKEKERQDRDKLQGSRTPGERATLYDLMTVQFTIGSTFDPGEIVMVPRTRGGYSYGRILQHFIFNYCYADSSVSHPTYNWRIVYPGPGGGNMFKDLPPAFIGKLVTILNKDVVLPKEEEGERSIGDKPLGKDLNNAVFAPSNKFNPHQMVLVPRSKGGFTYGRVVKECTFTCRLDDSNKHEINSWRVLVDDTNKVRKDVLAGNIGKLYIPERLQAAMQAASEAASLPLPNTNASSRRRVSPEAFPAPALTHAHSAHALSSAPALNYAQALQSNAQASPASAHSSLTSSSSAPVPIGDLIDPSNAERSDSSPIVSTTPPDPLSVRGEHAEGGDGTPNPPLRGVIALPDNVFARAQRDAQKPRRRMQHETNHENFNNGPDSTSENNSKRFVVIDGPNVAMKHGKKTFSTKGIQLAVQHYKSRAFDVVAFVPEYFASRKAPQHQLGSSTLKLGDFMNSVGADDMPLFNTLVNAGSIILTPAQDYDDSYSIEYARKHNCCIVTNDRYNDNIDKQPTEREKAQTRKFIRDHSISFTFVRDEFMPNPDFRFPTTT